MTLAAKRDVGTPCQRVWDVLADGWSYTHWVVGNSRTRAVDSTWPQPGAVIRHSVGVWPVVINDQTEVESSAPPHELVLRAGLGPLGAAQITMQIEELPDRSTDPDRQPGRPAVPLCGRLQQVSGGPAGVVDTADGDRNPGHPRRTVRATPARSAGNRHLRLERLGRRQMPLIAT